MNFQLGDLIKMYKDPGVVFVITDVRQSKHSHYIHYDLLIEGVIATEILLKENSDIKVISRVKR